MLFTGPGGAAEAPAPAGVAAKKPINANKSQSSDSFSALAAQMPFLPDTLTAPAALTGAPPGG